MRVFGCGCVREGVCEGILVWVCERGKRMKFSEKGG